MLFLENIGPEATRVLLVQQTKDVCTLLNKDIAIRTKCAAFVNLLKERPQGVDSSLLHLFDFVFGQLSETEHATFGWNSSQLRKVLNFQYAKQITIEFAKHMLRDEPELFCSFLNTIWQEPAESGLDACLKHVKFLYETPKMRIFYINFLKSLWVKTTVHTSRTRSSKIVDFIDQYGTDEMIEDIFEAKEGVCKYVDEGMKKGSLELHPVNFLCFLPSEYLMKNPNMRFISKLSKKLVEMAPELIGDSQGFVFSILAQTSQAKLQGFLMEAFLQDKEPICELVSDLQRDKSPEGKCIALVKLLSKRKSLNFNYHSSFQNILDDAKGYLEDKGIHITRTDPSELFELLVKEGRSICSFRNEKISMETKCLSLAGIINKDPRYSIYALQKFRYEVSKWQIGGRKLHPLWNRLIQDFFKMANAEKFAKVFVAGSTKICRVVDKLASAISNEKRCTLMLNLLNQNYQLGEILLETFVKMFRNIVEMPAWTELVRSLDSLEVFEALDEEKQTICKFMRKDMDSQTYCVEVASLLETNPTFQILFYKYFKARMDTISEFSVDGLGANEVSALKELVALGPEAVAAAVWLTRKISVKMR